MKPETETRSARLRAWLAHRGRRRLVLVFSAVFVAQAVLLVAAFLPTPHTGGDNAGYLTLAHSLVERGQYLELWDPAEPPHTKYPPVFPLILAGAILLGARTWISFKVLSLLFSSAAVLLTFAWVRDRRGEWFAAGVTILFVLSEALRWSSHWILSDPPFLALTLLALWAFQRSEGREEGGRWLLVGGAAAILAYFTRSAGLPLIVAAALWLVSHRRWRPLALFLGAFTVPAVAWWLRARAVGDLSYVSEFWMINPYDPGAGQAGIGDLVSRVLTNFHLYAGTYIPEGLLGIRTAWMSTFGYLLLALAGAGWARRLAHGRGVAEFFLPLYFGLILLWPEVWSGDRFALPLYPLILFYAGDALLDGAQRVMAPRRQARSERIAAPVGLATFGVGLAAFLVLALPSASSWRQAVSEASACSAFIERQGFEPFACYSGSTGEFVAAARWSGENLPEGAVVFSRKPRLFYVLSGVKSRIYPLSGDPETFIEEARAGGVGYLVTDHLDDVGPYYLSSVIRQRPDLVCSIVGWGRADEVGTDLLGLTIEGSGERSDAEREEAVQQDGTVVLDIPRCAGDMVRETPAASSLPLDRIPILAGMSERRTARLGPRR